jgi:hypothetical protein
VRGLDRHDETKAHLAVGAGLADPTGDGLLGTSTPPRKSRDWMRALPYFERLLKLLHETHSALHVRAMGQLAVSAEVRLYSGIQHAHIN